MPHVTMSREEMDTMHPPLCVCPEAADEDNAVEEEDATLQAGHQIVADLIRTIGLQGRKWRLV